MTDLRGDLVRLRARHEADVPVLQAQLHDDVATAVRGTRRPWRPVSPGSDAALYRVAEPTPDAAAFSVVELATDGLVGETALWAIDGHNRTAHVGIALLPSARGKGIGTDVVRVLCHYGFTVLGLHRLQIDTLADNHAMLAAAERAGFRRESVHRESVWAMGEFADEVVLGLLAREHAARS